MKIAAVIFDIGNVLLTFDYTVAEQEILRQTGRKSPPTQEKLYPLRLDHQQVP